MACSGADENNLVSLYLNDSDPVLFKILIPTNDPLLFDEEITSVMRKFSEVKFPNVKHIVSVGTVLEKMKEGMQMAKFQVEQAEGKIRTFFLKSLIYHVQNSKTVYTLYLYQYS